MVRIRLPPAVSQANFRIISLTSDERRARPPPGSIRRKRKRRALLRVMQYHRWWREQAMVRAKGLSAGVPRRVRGGREIGTSGLEKCVGQDSALVSEPEAVLSGR